MSGLGDVVRDARVLVAVGPGGVGKTSTSAALAMEAARLGRRTIVLTIDPARRLAQSLGLPEIGNVERAVAPEAFTRAGLAAPPGRLTAMMLDIKQSWDEVVRRHHPDPARRERLLNNRFYVALSSALAGSQEYMAMEKLHELASRTEDPLDLVVLDTPPSSHAIDFLEAPSKMIDALDNDATRWLLEPFAARTRGGRMSRGIFDLGSSLVVRSIGRFTGVETLEALAELLSCFQDMFDGFRQRARATQAILAAPTTRFVVVAAPRPGPITEAEQFVRRLEAEKLNVAGVVLNRATPDPFAASAAGDDARLLDDAGAVLRAALAALAAERGDAADVDGLAARLVEAARAQRAEAQAEAKLQARLGERFPGIATWRVPELSADVHSLPALDALRRALVDAR